MQERIVTAIGLSVGIAVVFVLPPSLMLGVLLMLGYVASAELIALMRNLGREHAKKRQSITPQASRDWQDGVGALCCLLAGCLVAVYAKPGIEQLWWMAAAMLVCMVVSLTSVSPSLTQKSWWVVCASLLTLALVWQGLYVFFAMYQWHKSMAVWLIVLTAMSDTSGYVWGKQWGQKKLFPQISPSKTEAGTAGMLIMPMLCAAGLQMAEMLPASVLWFAIGPLALIGDLWMSQLKRAANMKDTGSLFPGHGGILDRVDSHLLVLSCSAVLLRTAA